MNIITENMLDAWVNAHERDAQAVTVELVAKLVKALCPHPKQFRFPLGDSIGQHGVDGFIETDAAYNPYINIGISIWEIGSGANPQDKITEDYKKRLAEISGNQTLSQTTFVFVTPRSASRTAFTIKKQESWKKCRNSDGWKEIKIIDGTILCDWLSHFPAIAEWLYQIIHGGMCKFITPEYRWKILERIPSRENILITPEIFLCGRENIVAIVKRFLVKNSSHKLYIQTRYPNHLPDFISALIKQEKFYETNLPCDNILIVEEAESLHSLSQLEHSHVFVLGEEGDQDKMVKWCSQASQKGHSLILPKNPGGRPSEQYPVLPMPSPEELMIALEKASFPFPEAQLLTGKVRGNIPCLLRLLGDIGGRGTYWGNAEAQEQLALASFIGEWNEFNNADVDFIEEITGKNYEEWKRQLAQLPKLAATPLHLRRDGTCYFVSRFEGWQVGGSLFLQQDLERFLTTVEKTLTRVAASAYADPWQKILASSDKDKALPSDELVSAMAEALAIMGSHAAFWEHGSPGWLERRIAKVVDTLLERSNPGAWVQLNPILPLLAEAAPQAFLTRLAEQVSTEDFLCTLSATSINMFTSHPVTGVLWALEALSWFPQWLPQTVLLLSELSLVTLPENFGNRPELSLNEIFSPWVKYDTDTIQFRAELLEKIAKKYPKFAWQIILAISPFDSHRISFGIYMPHWREHENNTLLIQREWIFDDLRRQFCQISHLALTVLLQQDKLPLDELAKGIKHLPQCYDKIIDIFCDCAKTHNQNNAWEILSTIPSWIFQALSQPQKDTLNAAIEYLSPSDDYEHVKKYFGESIPEYDVSIDSEMQITQWHSAQDKHVTSIFSKDGLPGILRLVSMVKKPAIVGEKLAKVADAKVDAEIIRLLPSLNSSESTAESIFIVAYIHASYLKKKDAWLKEIWELAGEYDKLQILLSIPFTNTAWDLVGQLPQEVQLEYWQRVNCYPHPVIGKIDHSIDSLIAVKRNGDALFWLYYMTRYDIKLPYEKIIYLLLHPDNKMTSRAHIVKEMIDGLRNAKQCCDNKLADIELLWIDVYSHRSDGDSPECLNRRLLSDAKYFVYALCILYKPRNSEHKPDQSDEMKVLSHLFWRALDQLRVPVDLCFSGSDFLQWVNDALNLAKEEDRFEVACQHIGKILFYAPPDICGLWIDKEAAKLLNTYAEMQNGFHMEAINSRGAFWGSEGKEELKIANEYEKKSLELSREGYFSFSDCVNNIAIDYKNQSTKEKEKRINDF